MRGTEIIVGVAGASGGLLPRRFVELCLESTALRVLHLILSEPALEVARHEIDPAIDSPADWIARLIQRRETSSKLKLYDNDRVDATIASGSYETAGMIVLPCSAGTLGAIANGISRDLIQRAADVCLKERRPLVLAFRESPYSIVHVENMRRVTLAGAIVAPPTPAFYIQSPSMERFLDVYCARVARWVGIELDVPDWRWKGEEKPTQRRRTRRT